MSLDYVKFSNGFEKFMPKEYRDMVEHGPFGKKVSVSQMGSMPARWQDEPGQFAFASRDRVHSILEQSGWAAIDIQPLDVACTLPETELGPYLAKLGPLGRVLQEADDRPRRLVIATGRAAFEPHVHDTAVRFTAACWMVGARAPE